MSTLPAANRQIARAAGTVMLAYGLSNVAGLIRQILVTDAFGTGMQIEAFNAANRVSETLFNLAAGGALASAFIPILTGLLSQGDHKGAWKLISATANLVLGVLTTSALLAAIFAPQVVHYLLAPGFSIDPVKEALTINLLRLMLPSAVIFGISGLVMGILNSHQVFLIPALTPAMYQFGLIFGVLVLSPTMGIYGLAYGVLIGAGLHLALQIPILLRQRGKYFPILGLNIPAVRDVIRLMVPRLFGVAVVQLNFWVNTRLASYQPDGSVTGILLGFTLMLMPQAAIAQSIATAAMPTFSSQVARGKFDEMRSSLASTLRGVLLLSIPASLGLMILRQPLVALLYQHGEFTAHSTDLVAWALLWYAAGLVGHSVVEILARAFYSLHDTRTPVMIGIAAMGLNILFSVLFSFLFTRIGWMPHGGLALANSLATALEMIGLLVLIRRKLKGIEAKRVWLGVAQAAVAAIPMALVLWFWVNLTSDQAVWIVCIGGVVIGVVVYSVIILILGVTEIKSVLRIISQKTRGFLTNKPH